MGKTSFYYNGEFLGEIENLIVTDGINATLEYDMPNTNNRKNLKNLIEMLSDGHQDVAQQASDANVSFMKLDEALAEGKGGAIFQKFTCRKLEVLLELLEAHEKRVARVREEVREILKNIRLI